MTTFQPERLRTAQQFLDRWRAADEQPVISAAVGTAGSPATMLSAGWFSRDLHQPLAEEPIFLIASPTKPLTALAVMMLVEGGELLLGDRVSRFVPEFAAHGKQEITLAHCLTHTSGLPDMLSDNVELRRRQAPPSEFVRRVCELEPQFVPGHGVQYQSMGILMLAEVVQRVAKQPLAAILAERVFGPLGMSDTALGMPPGWEQSAQGKLSRRQRIVPVRATDPTAVNGSLADEKDFGWNSDYWHRFGAPWGGLLSTASDWSRLCRHLLAIHGGDTAGVISPAGLRAMTTNQLQNLPDVPEPNRRCTPWGLGWRLNWPLHSQGFGDLLSDAAYGHWGSTGTMVWIDPARQTYTVLLTNHSLGSDRWRHAEFSNLVCRAQS